MMAVLTSALTDAVAWIRANVPETIALLASLSSLLVSWLSLRRKQQSQKPVFTITERSLSEVASEGSVLGYRFVEFENTGPGAAFAVRASLWTRVSHAGGDWFSRFPTFERKVYPPFLAGFPPSGKFSLPNDDFKEN
jgi:hypothetical protein